MLAERQWEGREKFAPRAQAPHILGRSAHAAAALFLCQGLATVLLPLRPVLAFIEVISYFVRPVSHSIRLAGNMMAGHAVIKVFAAFAPMVLIGWIGILVTPLSVIAITAIFALEVLVAFIQAYVFTILTCVYLKDALHPHH